MFTGIVEGIGRVTSLSQEGNGIRLSILPPPEMLCDADGKGTERRPGVAIGDSVAINGCCLTVVAISDAGWDFQAGTETLSRTNLGGLQAGSAVNLERSLRLTDRLGGHVVQGHIDGIGRVQRIEPSGEWITMHFDVPASLTLQMVSKGSVAVDGVSLTLVDVTDQSFSVALIPHTLQMTTLGMRQVSDAVNIETDILGKYVQKLWLARCSTEAAHH